jgi:alkanesulfonate monooxygenase SsuD/methylene tetrahydromethanopterin reductase-like flavin-dependent oxidoreductase (luciferase family)
MDEERFRSYVVAGDPDAVCEQVAAYLDAGLDGMMFNLDDTRPDTIRLAGATLVRAFG